MPRSTIPACTAVAAIVLVASAGPAASQSARPANSSTPAAPPAHAAQASTIRPGTYDLEIVYGGGTLTGTLVLTPVGDSLAAKLNVGDHDSPVQRVVRNGSQLTLTGADGMRLLYVLRFAGDSVSGRFTFSDADGTVAGKRRK